MIVGIFFLLGTPAQVCAQEENDALEKIVKEEQPVEVVSNPPAENAKQDVVEESSAASKDSKSEAATAAPKDTNVVEEKTEASKAAAAKSAVEKKSSEVTVAPKVEEKKDSKKNKPNPFYEHYIKGKLQFGTRTVHRNLTDPDSGHRGGTYGSGTYLGTIYGLDEKQSYAPNKLFLSYNFTKYFGIEFAYDSIEVETLATSGTYDSLKTDGDASLAGPTISLIGRFANKTSITPFVGVGLGFFSGDFDETETWAYTDYGTYERTRVMEVESITSLLLTAGATWNIDKNWFVDCSVQYIQADPDATFYGYNDGVLNTEQTGHFPMSNVAFRLGVGYTF